MPIDYGWLATKISGSLGPSRIEYHRLAGKTVWRMKPPHKRKLELGSPAANPCRQWQQADAIWVGQDETWRQKWRNALKKPGISGYDLWMKEALTCCASNRFLPDDPSISGGWSTAKVIPGVTWPPEGKVLPIPPPPPADYFLCWNCPAGSYLTFYGRLVPDTPDCRYYEMFPWNEIHVMLGECVWSASLANSNIIFDLATPVGYVSLWTNATGPMSEMSLKYTSGPPCLGGFFDTLDWEGGAACSHGDHSEFKFEIYGVDY
jgi:hypothetical protein